MRPFRSAASPYHRKGQLSADQASRHTGAIITVGQAMMPQWLTPRRTRARSGNAQDLKRRTRRSWIIVPGDGLLKSSCTARNRAASLLLEALRSRADVTLTSSSSGRAQCVVEHGCSFMLRGGGVSELGGVASVLPTALVLPSATSVAGGGSAVPISLTDRICCGHVMLPPLKRLGGSL